MCVVYVISILLIGWFAFTVMRTMEMQTKTDTIRKQIETYGWTVLSLNHWKIGRDWYGKDQVKFYKANCLNKEGQERTLTFYATPDSRLTLVEDPTEPKNEANKEFEQDRKSSATYDSS